MFPDPVINLKTQAQSARIPKWIPDNVQKLARPVEDRLAVAVVSGNDACREVGLGVESQPAVAKRVVFTIWVFPARSIASTAHCERKRDRRRRE
jgi:hypothetical protein